jgi:hypothetical protein
MGKKVGLDSLYILDYTVDCESEGKSDSKTGKMTELVFR